MQIMLVKLHLKFQTSNPPFQVQIYTIGKRSHDKSRGHDGLEDLNAKIPVGYMQSC